MSEIVICSNPECQTTAGCRCGQGTRVYSGPGLVVVSEIVRVHPRDAEISRLTARIEELEKALKPFADELKDYPDNVDGSTRLWDCQLRVRDLRFARSTLEASDRNGGRK